MASEPSNGTTVRGSRMCGNQVNLGILQRVSSNAKGCSATWAAVGFDAAAGLEAEGDLQVEAAVGGAGAVGAAGDVVGQAEEG